MQKMIDCLLIGHNDITFAEYEKIIAQMGQNSGAYRDLNLNYIRYNNKPYTAAEIFNVLNSSEDGRKTISTGKTFSAAIAYLGSCLDRNGFKFDYVNAVKDDKLKLVEKLKQDNILTIAIITTLYVFAFPILEIIDLIKKYNQSAKIIVGGPFISTQVRTQKRASLEYLFQDTIKADIFVNSPQGEVTLVKVLHALKNNLPLDQIENIYYKTGNALKNTPIYKEENQLSENPVNWALFSENVGDSVNIRTAISCPFSCAFCGFPQHAGKYQMLDVEAIERELNLLDKIGTVKNVNFIDDTFNVPPKRFKNILRMLIKNQYGFMWHSYFRCQYADREMVELMKESGCQGVFLGIESGNARILKNMNKAVNLEKYREGINLLKKYGIVTFGSFIVGFPGETYETVQDTIRFIKESGLDFYRIQLWYCEPITPIWKEKEKYHLSGENFEWAHSTMTSKVACDLIDEAFLSIQTPIWVPQYNFDFHSIWHLVHQGMDLERAKEFLRIFYLGIKEKMLNSNQTELSFDLITQLINVCQRTIKQPDTTKEENILNKYDAEFNY